MNPELTIIICTFNRGHLLSETLPFLFQQNVSEDNYHVLIVDNNSTDNTSEIINGFKKRYDNLSVINEYNQGLAYARNAGMNVATTDWIVYLDDDAKIPKDFVKRAINNIHNHNHKCFGGVYLPWYKYGKPKWFHDKFASNSGKLSEFNTLKGDFISGGIMAIKKSVLNKFGGFPTNLGMSGKHVAYGEETLLQIRMRNSGIEIGYDPNWVIYHLVNRYKLSPWWFIKSGFVSGRDSWLIFEESVSIKKIIIYLFRSIKLFFVNFFKFTPRLIRKDYKWQNWLIDTLRPIVLKFGQIYGGVKLLFK
ncbi:glycosyltransferase family 2 protein [Candidatus Neomarinimicrobiota bacterium]